MISADFETFVKNSARMGLADDSYNVIGLCGESGEVAEWVKKALLRRDPRFTETMLLLELGDVVHYVARLAINHGWTLEQVMEANHHKLKDKYNDRIYNPVTQ